MHGANEPAKSDVVVQSLQAAPCFPAGGNVNKRKQNSCHDLQDEYGERRAAEDVPPAGRVSRDRMFGGFANRRGELQATVEPFSNIC